MVGAVELERALTAAKCLDDVPLGDLEELSGQIAFDVLRQRVERVDRRVDRGGWWDRRCEQGDGPGEFGTATGEPLTLPQGGAVVVREVLRASWRGQPPVDVVEVGHRSVGRMTRATGCRVLANRWARGCIGAVTGVSHT